MCPAAGLLAADGSPFGVLGASAAPQVRSAEPSLPSPRQLSAPGTAATGSDREVKGLCKGRSCPPRLHGRGLGPSLPFAVGDACVLSGPSLRILPLRAARQSHAGAPGALLHRANAAVGRAPMPHGPSGKCFATPRMLGVPFPPPGAHLALARFKCCMDGMPAEHCDTPNQVLSAMPCFICARGLAESEAD